MASGTYQVLPQRVQKAKEILAPLQEELSPEDIAGVLVEIGLGHCVIEWVEAPLFRFTMDCTDLQLVSVAAALSVAAEYQRLHPQPIFTEPDSTTLTADEVDTDSARF